MSIFRVHDVLKDRVLVSRESARLLEEPLSAMLNSAGSPADSSATIQLAVDFDGVEGIAPSFLDELLTILESLICKKTEDRERRLIVMNPPTRLSLKFEAIARGHGMSARVLPDGSWLLTDARSASP